MKYLLTRKSKKLTKDYKNSRLEITIPANQMIEVAYKTAAGEDRKDQIVGAFIYLKMGDNVFPSIVEFSGDEVEIIGEKIGKDDLVKEAVTNGKLFFDNSQICTCWEFVHLLYNLPFESFTTVNDNEELLRVSCGYKNALVNKQVLTITYY